MKRRKVTVAVLSVVLAAAALTGCGSAQQTNGPKKTRVVLNEVAHSIFYAPMYVAIEEGYFEDAGIVCWVSGMVSGVSGMRGP